MVNLKKKGHLWLGLLIFGSVVFSVNAADMEIKISNPRPTCSLTFDGKDTLTYLLGTMARGVEMRHAPFTLGISCKGSSVIKTALTARNRTGTLQSGDDSVMMRVDNQDVSNGTLLWLEASGGQRVKLSGMTNDAFCVRNDTSESLPNICQLRPVTNVPAGSPEGNIDVTILFDVVYL